MNLNPAKKMSLRERLDRGNLVGKSGIASFPRDDTQNNCLPLLSLNLDERLRGRELDC